MGWAGVQNGDLLKLAESEFDVFVTVDRNLSFQQPISKFTIPIVVLRSPSNRVEDLALLVPKLLKTLGELDPETTVVIEI